MLYRFSFFLLTFFILANSAQASNNDVVLTIPQGTLMGAYSERDNTVEVYKGIPYAEYRNIQAMQ